MEIDKKYLEWLASDDTGISSQTILSYLTGIPVKYKGTPHDMSDVGRCVRMLRLFPELRTKIGDVIVRDKSWMPFIDCWKELERRYDELEKWYLIPVEQRKKEARKKYFTNPAESASDVMRQLSMASHYLIGMRCQNSSTSWANREPNIH